MPKYKVSVSKWQKKYTIVLNADSDVLAKKKVHDEWYSILGVKKIDDTKIEGHKFLFEAIDKNWGIKKWKVVANDPFKVYVKLREWLWYNVKFLYSEEDIDKSEWEKLDILENLKGQYELYFAHNKKNRSSDSKEHIKEKEVNKKKLENFYLKKELDQTYRLIDFVLIKLKNVLEKAEDKDVNKEKKEKIQKLYNAIIKVKKSTNISKLKEVWELALKKIWEIELSIVEKYKDKDSKKLLKETNSLLKKIGSKEHFVEKDKDISYILHKIWEKIKDKVSFKMWKKSDWLDRESTSYWKTKLLIEKYQEKQKQNKLNILKNFYVFILPIWKNKEKAENLILRKKVINQNIVILKAKVTGKLVSYTKVIKWYNNFLHLFILLLKNINKYINIFIYISSILIILYFTGLKIGINFNFINFNIDAILTLVGIFILNILISLTSWVKTMILNIALYMFLLILWVVNF